MGRGVIVAVPIVLAILIIRLLTLLITTSAASASGDGQACGLGDVNATQNADQCGNGAHGVVSFFSTLIVGTIDGAPLWLNVIWSTIQNVLIVFYGAEIVRSFIPFLPGG